MKHHHLAGLKTRLAMAVRFRPQPVRKSQYTLLIGIFSYSGLEINTLFSVLFLSDALCSSKRKKELYRIKDLLENSVQVQVLSRAPRLKHAFDP